MPTLIQSNLGIHSLLKRQPLKHNVIDRDKILIPPNWDSWGKIRVLREGFDVEGISAGWSLEIQPQRQQYENNLGEQTNKTADSSEAATGQPESGDETLRAYEDIIKDPKGNSKLDGSFKKESGLEFEAMSMQEFLGNQADVMERLKAEEESGESETRPPGRSISANKSRDVSRDAEERSRVGDHIGPVQFNMGGIQVDAEDMLNRLKDREREETPDRDPTAAVAPTPDGKQQNEALASFFAGLIKRGGSNSPKPTPR